MPQISLTETCIKDKMELSCPKDDRTMRPVYECTGVGLMDCGLKRSEMFAPPKCLDI